MNSAINSVLREEYSGTAKFFHWTVAACVLVTIPLGMVMGSLPEGPAMNAGFTIHKSLGVLILFLMILRLAYRLIVGWPAPEPTITSAQRIVSHAVHNLLYLLLIVQGLLGWYANSVYGAATPFFGLFNLPNLAEKDEAFAKQLFLIHEVIGVTIAGLLILHIGAALYHYFIRRDGVLQRMLP